MVKVLSAEGMSTGARAMSTALVLFADGKRANGKWSYGAASLGNCENLRNWQKHMQLAGTILDFAPELSESVISGDLALAVQLHRKRLRHRTRTRI